MQIDSSAIRRQFPFLEKEASLAYLDSAATCQKPNVVLSAMTTFATETNANVNRGVYPLAEKATVAFNAARKTIATFINAKPHEIIFTKNATEAINLIARSYGDTLQKGDVIALSIMEHHSNIVPWQQLQERKGTSLSWISIDEEGQLDLAQLETVLKQGKVKLVTITGLSNVLGIAPDLTHICTLAHQHGALVLVDASQLIAHRSIDIKKINCDFLIFSGHKLYGPTGIGVLYGKTELLEAMPPFLGGGDMIQTVTKTGFTCAELPRKFEAGTPPAMEAVGLVAAIRWLASTDVNAVHAYTEELLSYALTSLLSIEGIKILGTQDASKRIGCISFTLGGIHPHDLTDVLGQEGVCLRAGHHCTQPLHEHLGIIASARLSVAAYNTKEEIDRCVMALKKAQKLLQK